MPLKPLRRAKSRLAPVSDAARADLALAFALDTVTAALECPAVSCVVLVTDDTRARAALDGFDAGTSGVRVTADVPASGLNPALEHGAALAREAIPERGVVAVSADLPALRPAELGRVLHAALRWPRSFLPDTEGVGSTLLAAAPGVALRPMFGTASRSRHRASGAWELAPGRVESARRDVDTVRNLREAFRLGVGAHTARLAGVLEDGVPAAEPRPGECALRRPASSADSS